MSFSLDLDKVGSATRQFWLLPRQLSFESFLGVVFLIVLVSVYWSRFVNDLA